MEKNNIVIQVRSERLVDISLDLSALIDFGLTGEHLSNNGKQYWIVNHRERLTHPRLSNVTLIIQAYISEPNYEQEREHAERVQEAHRLRDSLMSIGGFIDTAIFNDVAFDELDDNTLLTIVDNLKRLKK
jgi:hypothetical protein